MSNVLRLPIFFQGTEEIEGIFLDTSNLGFDVKPTAFENMLNLRLLKIYSSNSEIHPVFNFPKGLLLSLPKELSLLHWENYPLQCLLQNFDPINLVEINMPYSQLQKLWDGTKNLKMLRTIRFCHAQQLVDIGDLLIDAQNLKVIDLQGCMRLQSFPATGQLLHLRVLNLSGCTEIKSFPEVPSNLETLHPQGTGIRGLPLSIVKPNGGELESLLAEFQGLSDALKLERITGLVKSSSSCQDLGKLICLDLKDCSGLQSLPNMGNLEFLKVLDLSGCSNLENSGFPPKPERVITCWHCGSSVMTQLNPIWKSTLMGFSMVVEVAFSEGYYDAAGVRKVQKDHMFVFYDVKMRPNTGDGNDPNIIADLVVFEFFPVDKQKKCLDDTCTVTRCEVYVITASTGNTSLEHISTVLSLDQLEFSGNKVEEVLRVSYEGLQDIYKALFLYVACLFNDEDVNLVAPLIASIDVDVSLSQ
ncbi:unnamed protein product [Thlaspi arvense]|uniref:Uncharacterized protein n=1 Tax=Thlaspi arvense TaxID=13288 RepID=A0AAU9RQY9_THLAR|nr:unnamed protein product [Thlaspi arvense]